MNYNLSFNLIKKMKIFIVLTITGIAYSFYMNSIYYKEKFSLKCKENDYKETYQKLLIGLNKIKAKQIECENNEKCYNKGLNLTEIRNHVNNSSKCKDCDNAILYYQYEEDFENPFWYEY